MIYRTPSYLLDFWNRLQAAVHEGRATPGQATAWFVSLTDSERDTLGLAIQTHGEFEDWHPVAFNGACA